MKHVVCMVAAVFGLASCGSLETLSFDQLNPASYSFPRQVRNVAVINRMPPIAEAKANLVTLGDSDGDGKMSTEALASALADSKYFNKVVLCDSALYAPGQQSLSPETVGELTDGLDADMLISLERVLIQKARYDLLYSGAGMPWPVVRVKVTPVINLYMPSREKPVRMVYRTDSLEWNVDDVISDRAMLKMAASFAAQIASHELVPYWTSADRFYYAGGSSEMRDAVVWVKEDQWNKAYDVWKSLFDASKSEKVKLKTAFNLALASEMTGQIEQAETWMAEAKKRLKSGTREEAIWKLYASQLEKRKEDYVQLDAQMSRF